MGQVIYPRKGEVHTAPITFKPPENFADATWSEIIEACERNMVPDTWVVGDQKVITIGGTDYPIDIIGKNHDEYSDGSGTAPLTFQMNKCYGTAYFMNDTSTNVGGWGECKVRTSYLLDILALMPSEVQAGIKEVNKLTSAGNKSTTIITTADKLFLLAESEVFSSKGYSVTGEGTQYEYYAAGNTAKKKRSGSTSTGVVWWLRSPRSGYDTYFCSVNTSGAKGSTKAAGTARYLAFAFCF